MLEKIRTRPANNLENKFVVSFKNHCEDNIYIVHIYIRVYILYAKNTFARLDIL